MAQPIILNQNNPDKTTISDYNDLFDTIHESTIITPPQDENTNVSNITEQNPVNNVIYTLQYDSLQTALLQLGELKNLNGALFSEVTEIKNSNRALLLEVTKHRNSNETMLLKMDHMQSTMDKITAQNETMMKIQMESCKKLPNSSSFIPVTNINSKEQLDDLEKELEQEEFFQNMVCTFYS